jgi:hypothetical protein
MRVTQPRQHGRLTPEVGDRALERLGVPAHETAGHLLDCHRRAAEPGVLGLIDRAHAATRDQPGDPVAPGQHLLGLKTAGGGLQRDAARRAEGRRPAQWRAAGWA